MSNQIVWQMQIKYSNTTLVKVKLRWMMKEGRHNGYSNTTLVKVKYQFIADIWWHIQIQIQHLLKLNRNCISYCFWLFNSNTTLVKVKFGQTTVLEVEVEFKYNTC